MRKLIVLLLTVAVLTSAVHAAPAGYVALTFDDGPSGDNTLALMKMLDERQVQATFFLCGYRMEAYPELAAKLCAAGHALGVHGYSHTCFDAMPIPTLRGELEATRKLIEQSTGCTPVLLRPPCGAWNETVRSECRSAGMSVILWSVDPEDWRCRDSDEIVRRVCAEARNGSIILMHDLYPSSVGAAARIIDILHKEGYAFVTVPRLAELARCSLGPGDVFSQFSGAGAPENTD